MAKEFTSFYDLLKKCRRGPQVILPKDASLIIAYAGIKLGDKIVDAGTGSGWLALQLSKAVGPEGRVITYENRKEFAKLAKHNFEFMQANKMIPENIILKEKDIYKGIAEKNIDVITLDLPEPWRIIRRAEKSLKKNGILVSYLPQMTQVIELVKKLHPGKWKVLRINETIERRWRVDGRICRPESGLLGHTGFLVFARKN